jgi:hypothetical protein
MYTTEVWEAVNMFLRASHNPIVILEATMILLVQPTFFAI